MEKRSDWKALKREGYRVVSRKSGIAARVDREDWEEYCKETMHPVCPDFYRRVLSKDQVYITPYAAKKLPNSQHNPVGFIAKKTNEA